MKRYIEETEFRNVAVDSYFIGNDNKNGLKDIKNHNDSKPEVAKN